MKDTPYTTETEKTHYLWHLAALGVLDADADGKIDSTLWDEIAAQGEISPSTVVMIDVGCSFAHPNLAQRVDAAASIDFTGGPEGQRMARDAGKAAGSNFAGLDTSALRLDGLDPADQSLFSEVVEHLQATTGHIRSTGDVETNFSSHGTSVAGLVVGGPELRPDPDTPPTPGVIPYFGVDPFSRLVSVRTGFDDDPLQFIAALLYTWAQAPDVIVMPRGLPDPSAALMPKDDFQAELESWASRDAADLLHRIEAQRARASHLAPHSVQSSLTGARLWRIVRSLFIAISKHVPIVCASGNEGESQLLYPANLATRENGIIAVGAVTANGYRSGYANYGEGLTLVAPSDDMVLFNQNQQRDTEEQAAKQAHLRPDGAQQVPFSTQALLATDIAGHFGYEFGQGDDLHASKGGYYTQFGGTSGAAALVAGVIALIRRAERATSSKGHVMDGTDLRALLTSTARSDVPGPKGTSDLRADSMNTTTEEAEDLRVFFGAGVIDARAAVREVLG